ncbi:hypothetical protein [Roseibium sp.]|uniref:hypothetical protein n=1 Tax=Roseibium sp. TaxID=1936156 RepID=UPI003A983B7C
METKSRGERQKQLEEPLTLAEDVRHEGGRSGGNVARDVGTEDHMKRAFERPGGATRVTGEHEKRGARK